MEEKKNKSLIIIIVILVILLLGSIGYIVYDNFIKEDEVTENNDIQNNNNNDNQDNNNDNQDNGGNNEEENDELSEEELERLGENLFNKTNILLTGTAGDYMLYQEDDITYNDLENSQRLEYVYMQIPNSEKTITSTNGYSERVTTDVFEKYYHQMFGLDKSINYETFGANVDKLVECNLDGEYLTCNQFDGGGALDFRTYLNYDYAKQDNEDILVYVNFLVSGFNDTGYGIFSDAAMSNKIAEDSSSFTDDNIFDIYGNEAGLYKLTFKKDTNDNYYWYRSEIVK